jgi:hypothetical protein
MASRSVTVVVNNATVSDDMILLSSPLSHGEWDVPPPPVIPAGVVTAWTSQSDGFLTGTQGTAQYQVGADPSHVLTLEWDNPYAGSNSYSASVPQPFNVAQHGGPGDNSFIVWQVRR